MKRMVVVVAALAVGISAAGCSVAEDSGTTSPTPTRSSAAPVVAGPALTAPVQSQVAPPPVTKTPVNNTLAKKAKPTPKKTAKPAGPHVGDGTWKVGSDVPAGSYVATVPANALGCYWQTAKNASGDLSSIEANENMDGGSHGRVTLAAGQYFKTDGCGTWTKAPVSNAHPPTSAGDGTWLVGVDIATGSYSTTVPAKSLDCYWGRSKDATGSLNSVIANDNLSPGAHGLVNLVTGDVFKSSGCGVWKLAK